MIVIADFVMQMRAGAAARAALDGDDVAFMHDVACVHPDFAQMPVARDDAETMIDVDGITVCAVTAGGDDFAVGGAIDFSAVRPGEIEPGMKGEMAGERIDAPSERALF